VSRDHRRLILSFIRILCNTQHTIQKTTSQTALIPVSHTHTQNSEGTRYKIYLYRKATSKHICSNNSPNPNTLFTMPEKYKDWWFEDLPAECKKAAAAMGYTTQESWDDDHPVPYDTKKFADLTLSEKRAALFLGWDVVKEKLDIWWEDTDPGMSTCTHVCTYACPSRCMVWIGLDWICKRS
jgi:hypothetical protein